MARSKILFSLFLAVLFFPIFSVTSFAQTAAAEKYVAIRLLPEKTHVSGGERITIGIEQNIARHWHTYWINPGDSGTAPRITWSGVEGIEPAPIQWPVPKRLPMGPLTNFGYENNVVLLQDLILPKDLPDGPATLTAKIDILVCNEICIPETHEASFIINGDEEGVPAAIEIARASLPLPLEWDAAISEKEGKFHVNVITQTPDAFAKLDSIELYPEEWGLIDNPEKTAALIKEGALLLSHPRGDRPLSDVPASRILIAYEDASGARKGISLATPAPSLSGSSVVPNDNVGIAQAILFALLGGLILNLMPCVFPILSMKALSLVELKDEELSKARLHGIAYTVGILVSFAAIAGLLLALKAGGAQIGWGFQLQNPAIILFLSYLFFALGLNLAGFFEIPARFSNIGSSLTQKSGAAGSFFTGVLATIVATPCTAPFMGVAMGYALTQGAVLSMAVFLALGLGLAIPYLLLTFVPRFRRIMPKPGHWMETFRQFLAFPMFASAAWLIWVLSQQTDQLGLLIALLGLVLLAFAIWLLKRNPVHKFWKIGIPVLTIIAMVLLALSVLSHDPAPKTENAVNAGWENFTQERLDALLEENNPVFVNMTAAWCITCKVNEKVALSSKAIKELFAAKKIAYLKGDWTNQNPEITKFLERYGRSGVPLYVYYGPEDPSGERPPAVVLPQILTQSIVEDTIDP